MFPESHVNYFSESSLVIPCPHLLYVTGTPEREKEREREGGREGGRQTDTHTNTHTHTHTQIRTYTNTYVYNDKEKIRVKTECSTYICTLYTYKCTYMYIYRVCILVLHTLHESLNFYVYVRTCIIIYTMTVMDTTVTYTLVSLKLS